MAEVAFDDVSKVYADGTTAVEDSTSPSTTASSWSSSGRRAAARRPRCGWSPAWRTSRAARVRIGDRVVNHVPSRDRDIAMVFQSYALYPHLSVYENIAFGLRVRKLPKAGDRPARPRRRRTLGIEQLLKRKPRALSGGQRQRVAMGRAIVRQPAAFLMDEPLSNLDAKLRVQMRAEIHRLQRELGVTTIYVTHDQVEAMTMGDRVAVMRKGELQQVAHAAGAVRPPGQPLRGRLHRQPGDEPARGRRRARPATTWCSCSARSGCSWATARRARWRTTPAAASSSGSGRKGSRTPRFDEHRDTQQSLTARVELREALGSEIVLHLRIDAAPAQTDETRELAQDVGNERAVAGAGRRSPRRARGARRPSLGRQEGSPTSRSRSTRSPCTSSIPRRVSASTTADKEHVMTRPRLSLLGPATLLVALVVAACGGSDARRPAAPPGRRAGRGGAAAATAATAADTQRLRRRSRSPASGPATSRRTSRRCSTGSRSSTRT